MGILHTKARSVMKRIIPLLCAAAFSVTAIGAAVAPAVAAPVHNAQQHAQKPRFEQHGSYALYNGHRGYKTKHAGYRYYNGYWFPPAAFVIGGIVGAIIGSVHH
jgi:hypothetical protein